jgi:hypothetical protein
LLYRSVDVDPFAAFDLVMDKGHFGAHHVSVAAKAAVLSAAVSL